MRSPAWLALFATLGAACIAPPSPVERLTNAAYDLNNATRFGRMDVAVSLVAEHAQGDFVSRHSDWGRSLRVLDVELGGMRLLTPDTAEVTLSVSWQRYDESTMRTSIVAQKWMRGDEGWQLAAEERAAGSPGLFKPPKDERKPAKVKSRPLAPSTAGQL
jgi:hypothetical protein